MQIVSVSSGLPGHFKGLTPDLARALACWTVLIAVRRGEVLNGRERGMEGCLFLGQRVGRHVAGSRRQRVIEEELWRAVFTKADFEKLKAIGHIKDIVVTFIGELKNLRVGRQH